MSLALVALLGAPADAGTWLFTLQAINPTPTGNPGPQWTAPSPASGSISTSYNTWISNTNPTTVSLDLCVTATWQAANAQDLAPTQVPILETATAGYGVTGGGQVNWLPDDGLGDVPTFNYDSVQRTTNGMTQGLHLRICDGSSGTFTFTRALSVTSVGTNPAFVGSGSVSYRVAIDSRAVTISCPLVDTSINGGSKYRFPALTGPITTNWRLSDGTLRGDTVLFPDVHSDQIGGDSQSFTYHANVAGVWAAGTAYHWYSSLTGYNNSGSGSVPDFAMPVPYTNAGIPVTTNNGATDHLFLSLYDSGAEGTANYYLHFHDEWEPLSWPPDGPAYKVMGPDPEVPSWPPYPWKMITPLLELTYPNLSVQVTYQEPGIESVEGGLDLGIEPVTLHFALSGNPTDKFTTTQTLTPLPPLAIGQETWAVSREIVSRTKGHLDHYQTHGYSGSGAWRHDVMLGIDVNCYTPYPSTSTLPSNPPLGWNPPGYH